MGNAMRIRNDQAWTVVSLGFKECFKCVLVFGSHGHARYIDIAITHGHQPEIFLRRRLSSRATFGYGGPRRGLGRLSSSIGVNLGVEHQQVHVAPTGQHMIESAVTNVVCPTIAADN